MSAINPVIQDMIDQATGTLGELLLESEKQILEAMAHASTEAALNESADKFSLTFKITRDASKRKWVHEIAWSQKQKRTIESEIKDPRQTEMEVVQ